jgi:choline dehydrogenase-like flavoprotein
MRMNDCIGSDSSSEFDARVRRNRLASPRRCGRSLPLSMDKVLGGGSSVNVMLWARGHRNDWDHFACESADSALSYESVLSIYRRIEDWQGAEAAAGASLTGLRVRDGQRQSVFSFYTHPLMDQPNLTVLTHALVQRLTFDDNGADLEAYVRDAASQSRGARMRQLAVADGSIMPRITTGNTMAPCVVIGERAADAITSDHRL